MWTDHELYAMYDLVECKFAQFKIRQMTHFEIEWVDEISRACTMSTDNIEYVEDNYGLVPAVAGMAREAYLKELCTLIRDNGRHITEFVWVPPLMEEHPYLDEEIVGADFSSMIKFGEF